MVVELPLDQFLDLVGRDELAVDAPVVDHFGATGNGRLHLPRHLLEVHLGHDHGAHLFGHVLDAPVGNGQIVSGLIMPTRTPCARAQRTTARADRATEP